MMRILAGAGLLSLSLLVLYSVKKIYEYRDIRRMDASKGFYEDCGIYKAADAFAQGASVQVMEKMLSMSYELNPERIEETLVLAFPHQNDSDGGYRAFIQAVNQVLEEDIYQVNRYR